MKKGNYFTAFLAGAFAMMLLFLAYKSFNKIADTKSKTDYYLLTNQITKMNKMVVLEQDFSSMQKTKLSYEILGNKVSDNEIITFTKTNAQVSYDLNKMKLDVDSINQKLIIKSLPNPDIRISPNVEIQSMDDSFFNRIDDEQIKRVTQTAKENAAKNVDQNKLKTEGRKQLMENLNNIFVLAKALNYQIIDETNTFDVTKL